MIGIIVIGIRREAPTREGQRARRSCCRGSLPRNHHHSPLHLHHTLQHWLLHRVMKRGSRRKALSVQREGRNIDRERERDAAVDIEKEICTQLMDRPEERWERYGDTESESEGNGMGEDEEAVHTCYLFQLLPS